MAMSDGNKQELSSGKLYDVGLELRICANSWEPEARLLGNIKASELKAMASDYVRLRLQAGISDADPSDTMAPDNCFFGTPEQAG